MLLIVGIYSAHLKRGSCADYLRYSLDRSVTTSIFEGLRYICNKILSKKKHQNANKLTFSFFIYIYRYISWVFFLILCRNGNLRRLLDDIMIHNQLNLWESCQMIIWHYNQKRLEHIQISIDFLNSNSFSARTTDFCSTIHQFKTMICN